MLVVIAAALFFAFRALRPHLPPRDHKLALRADAYTDKPTAAQLALARQTWQERIFDRDLVEKTVLVGFITMIFAQILPNATTSPLGILVNVALFIIANTAASHFLARRGMTSVSPILHFLAVLLLNSGLVLVGHLLGGGTTNWFNATFFVVLLSLIVTLFDRFQPIHLARFPRGPLAARPAARE